MPKDFGRRLPLDAEIVREIMATPRLREEQGPGFLESWGGPASYQSFARIPVEERVVYFAVQQGYTTQVDISDATGLTVGEVSKALTRLSSRGLVETGVVAE